MAPTPPIPQQQSKLDTLYNLFLVLTLIALLILIIFIDLIVYTIVSKSIDIKYLIDNNIINTIQNLIDSEIIENLFGIFMKIINKIIPLIYNFFNVL
jgi:hypothetical protein